MQAAQLLISSLSLSHLKLAQLKATAQGQQAA
jgi:hypothetical protein